MSGNDKDFVNRYRGDRYQLDLTDSLLADYNKTREELEKLGKNPDTIEDASILEKQLKELEGKIESAIGHLNLETVFDKDKYRDVRNLTDLTISEKDDIEIAIQTPITDKKHNNNFVLQPAKFEVKKKELDRTPDLNIDLIKLGTSTPLSSKKSDISNIKKLDLHNLVRPPIKEEVIEEIKAHLSADFNSEAVNTFFEDKQNKEILDETLKTDLSFPNVIEFFKKIFLRHNTVKTEADKEKTAQILDKTELPFASAQGTFFETILNAENDTKGQEPENVTQEGLDAIAERSIEGATDGVRKIEEFKDANNTKTDEMTTTQVRGLSIKDALELIPRFNGENITLTQFLDGCQEALSILPPNYEKELAKLIRIRLYGNALNSMRGREFSNISEVADFLDKIFGSSKTFHDWEGELAKIKQKNNETVIVYFNRLREIEDEIVKAAAREGRINDVDEYKKVLEKDCVKFFLKGLRWEIRARVGKKEKLKEALEEALEVEKEYVCSVLDSSTEGEEKKVKFLKETKRVHFVEEETPSKCNFCKLPGHVASNCVEYIREIFMEVTNNLQNLSNNQSSRNVSNNKTNFEGWNAENRRRIPFLPDNRNADQRTNLPNNNNNNNNNNRYNNNNRNFNNRDFNNRNFNNRDFNNRNFNNRDFNNRNFNSGNSARNNQGNFNNNNGNTTNFTNNRPVPTCFYCGKTGHLQRNCFKQQNDMRRSSPQNQGNGNALSHTGARRENSETPRPVEQRVDSISPPAPRQ